MITNENQRAESTKLAESSKAKIRIDKSSLPLEILLNLHSIGFKLVPLAKDSKTPTLSSTNDIYNNSDYWTPQKLETECYRFSNIGTTYGRTHIKDKLGKELYLNELDVDSNEVFTRLGIVRIQDKEYFFIDEMRRITYVVKTRKPYGYRLYWLSHKQHPPIRTQDCKLGHEFEVKTDNTSGHGTLPPSRHRDDVTFRYQAIGQNIISVQDKLYDGILKVLADCLKPRKQNHTKPEYVYRQENCISLSHNDMHKICDLIRPRNDVETAYSSVEKLMQQFTFKTVRDTEEIYYYDETREVYQSLGETIIKEQLEILYPAIRTCEVMEIINKIKRRTYVESAQFHQDPNLLNLRNGILNIMTGTFSPHTPDHLSLVQLPVFYDPTAKCPNILRFLAQVLRPKDIFTVLQLFGYCLYGTAKYEKVCDALRKGRQRKEYANKTF